MRYRTTFALMAALVTTAASSQTPSKATLELRRHFMEPGINALTFHTIDSIFATKPVAHGARSTPLEGADHKLDFTYIVDGKNIPAEDMFERTFTNALIVIKDGRIVAERYRNFTNRQSHFLSMSMAKSVTSILVGIAMDQGKIKSLDEQLTAYVPELKGSAYDGVTLRDTIDMKTGVDRDDGDQLKPGTTGAALREQILVQNVRRATDEALVVKRKAAPGGTFEYSTLNTTVMAWVLERATGQRYIPFMTENLWKPLGAESDGFWIMDGTGPDAGAMAGLGFNATARDYARIGLMMLAKGRAEGKQIVSEHWVRESTEGPHTPVAPGAPRGYQHFWWTDPGKSAFMALGLQGQVIYVDPATRTVIVKMSYEPLGDRASGVESQAFFRAASAWAGH
jgi:CubicO group peptidase (beta-lactamase class C family)